MFGAKGKVFVLCVKTGSDSLEAAVGTTALTKIELELPSDFQS